jgi:hypothetical protein
MPHPSSAMVIVSKSEAVSTAAVIATSAAPALVEFSATSNTFKEISVIMGF